MSKSEMPGGAPITELTGKPTDAQAQIVRAINLIVAGQEIAQDIELAPEIIEKIKAFAKSEPKTVEGSEWLPPEDLREKILVIALPEQPEILAKTNVFLSAEFTNWQKEPWLFTYLDKNVFAPKATGIIGQPCKFFAHNQEITGSVLGKLLTKSDIREPGIDVETNKAWFLSGGRPPGSHQNDTW